MEKRKATDLLFETGLRHIYSAEQEIEKNLKLLAEKAISSKLKELFEHHREETKKQTHRLEEIFVMLKIDPKASKIQGIPSWTDKSKELLKSLLDLNFTDRSKGIDGILSEGKEMMRHFGDTDANDIALVCDALKVEHFEMACYQSLIQLADHFGMKNIADLLQETWTEELQTAKKLSKLADFLESDLALCSKDCGCSPKDSKELSKKPKVAA